MENLKIVENRRLAGASVAQNHLLFWTADV
jgi:hypothetical protein